MSGNSTGSGGNVTHLDTINFRGTITAYTRQVSEFRSIVSGVDRTVNTVLGRWEGEGRDAFETDSNQVRQNLEDICEIMDEMRESLIAAQEVYGENDVQTAEAFRAEE